MKRILIVLVALAATMFALPATAATPEASATITVSHCDSRGRTIVLVRFRTSEVQNVAMTFESLDGTESGSKSGPVDGRAFKALALDRGEKFQITALSGGEILASRVVRAVVCY